MIVKLERVPLKEVGWHEALDFTRWLEKNIEAVNEVTDLNLVSAEREKSAGTFRVDIVAEDGNANPVIIENQLTKSDHDHLGKLITYLTAFDAKAAVWIVSDPRPEHVASITWLNESANADFYLLKVEAVKIGDSEAAPLLTLIVGPSEETKEIGETKKEIAERHIVRERFWKAFLEKANKKTTLHAAISPSRGNWISAGAGKSGLSFGYVIRQRGPASVELYIDRGRDLEEENRAIFDKFVARKTEIEKVFGGKLAWEPLEGKRACRIKKNVETDGYGNEENWPVMQETMIDVMVRLEKAFRPFIENLEV